MKMMNKFVWSLSILALLASCFTGCEKPIEIEPELTVTPATVSLAAEGGTANFVVTTNVADWTFEDDAEWLTVTKAKDEAPATTETTVTLTAAANEVEEARTASVTITAGTLTKVVSVTQAAKAHEATPEPEDPDFASLQQVVYEFDLVNDASTEYPLISIPATDILPDFAGGEFDAMAALNIDSSKGEYTANAPGAWYDAIGLICSWGETAMTYWEYDGENFVVGHFPGQTKPGLYCMTVYVKYGETEKVIRLMATEVGDYANKPLFELDATWAPNADAYLDVENGVGAEFTISEYASTFSDDAIDYVVALNADFSAGDFTANAPGAWYDADGNITSWTDANASPVYWEYAAGVLSVGQFPGAPIGNYTMRFYVRFNGTEEAVIQINVKIAKPTNYISEVRDMCEAAGADGAVIEGEVVVEGIVISDYVHGNQNNKQLVIQDFTGGLMLFCQAAPEFPVGSQVRCTLTGAKAMMYSQGIHEISDMPVAQIEAVETTMTLSVMGTPIEDILAGGYDCSLVRLENVTFTDPNATIPTKNASLYVQNEAGDEIAIYFSKYNTFGGGPVPPTACNVTGYVSCYNGTYQLIIRDLTDIFFGEFAMGEEVELTDANFFPQAQEKWEGSLAALVDEDLSTFYHSTWSWDAVDKDGNDFSFTDDSPVMMPCYLVLDQGETPLKSVWLHIATRRNRDAPYEFKIYGSNTFNYDNWKANSYNAEYSAATEEAVELYHLSADDPDCPQAYLDIMSADVDEPQYFNVMLPGKNAYRYIWFECIRTGGFYFETPSETYLALAEWHLHKVNLIDIEGVEHTLD